MDGAGAVVAVTTEEDTMTEMDTAEVAVEEEVVGHTGQLTLRNFAILFCNYRLTLLTGYEMCTATSCYNIDFFVLVEICILEGSSIKTMFGVICRKCYGDETCHLSFLPLSALPVKRVHLRFDLFVEMLERIRIRPYTFTQT